MKAIFVEQLVRESEKIISQPLQRKLSVTDLFNRYKLTAKRCDKRPLIRSNSSKDWIQIELRQSWRGFIQKAEFS